MHLIVRSHEGARKSIKPVQQNPQDANTVEILNESMNRVGLFSFPFLAEFSGTRPR